MRITYIANLRLPTEKAHGAQIMKACEAYVREGSQLELVVPTRRNAITVDPFEYYGVSERFPIRMLFAPDTVGWGSVGFVVQNICFGLACALRVPRGTLVYSRDELVLAVFALFRRDEFVWESHDGRCGMVARFVARRAKRMVVVTKAAKDMYVECGVSADKIMAIPNGIDLASFAVHESRDAARARLGLPAHERVALYIGALGGWKGTDTLLEASRHLAAVRVAVIGGSEKQLAPLRAQYEHVIFLGERPFRELADNQAAADVLVVPNTATSEISVRFTSPLKLIAHMASGVPIVASDLPSIRELASDAALLVTPDDSKALAAGIERLVADQALSQRLVERARARVESLDWRARAKAILAHMSVLS